MNSVSFSADGKLLATGWYNNNAYAWGVSAMVKEAGLDDLLLDQRDKFLLAGDAARCPVRQQIIVLQHQVPARHRIHPRLWAFHVSTFVAGFHLYSIPYAIMFTMPHPDSALSTGFIIVYLLSLAVKILSCVSVALQPLMSHIGRNIGTHQHEKGRWQ